jgi:hypothetical protein
MSAGIYDLCKFEFDVGRRAAYVGTTRQLKGLRLDLTVSCRDPSVVLAFPLGPDANPSLAGVDRHSALSPLCQTANGKPRIANEAETSVSNLIFYFFRGKCDS